MNFSNAIVRKPGISYSNGITTSNLGKPDITLTLKQHEKYCRALEKCGLIVECLEAAPSFPDSVFVEDTAIITGKMAVLTRPGDHSNYLLIHEQFSDHPAIRDWRKIIVPEKETYAANIIRINDYLLVADGFPETLNELKQLKLQLLTINMS